MAKYAKMGRSIQILMPLCLSGLFCVDVPLRNYSLLNSNSLVATIHGIVHLLSALNLMASRVEKNLGPFGCTACQNRRLAVSKTL